jgi:RNase P subunit RPR2
VAEIEGYDDSVKKRCTCKNCGAIIKYVKADIRTYRGKDWGGFDSGNEWIKCPGCGEDITIRSW